MLFKKKKYDFGVYISLHVFKLHNICIKHFIVKNIINLSGFN